MLTALTSPRKAVWVSQSSNTSSLFRFRRPDEEEEEGDGRPSQHASSDAESPCSRPNRQPWDDYRFGIDHMERADSGLVVHERRSDGAEIDILTKGDNNLADDRGLYAHRQLWLQQHHIVGRAKGYLPYVGWLTILMTEKPVFKYLLIGALGLLVITSKD
ncbi:hypothetical protein EJB05_19108, partial [Eragrostis curvula]